MKIGLLEGFAQQTTHHLMLRLRNLFSYSVGCFLLILSVLIPFLIDQSAGSEIGHIEVKVILFFSIAELCIWFSFIRTWREVQKRINTN
jgi:hypothetical protein